MRTKIYLAVAVVVLAGIAGIGMTVGSAASSSNGPGTTITVYAKGIVALDPLPEVGTWGPVAWELYEVDASTNPATPKGPVIGRAAGACFRATSTDGVCVGWYQLGSKGSLHVSELPGTGVMAVTGGTGEYAGATGVGYESAVPGVTDNDYVVTFQLAG